MNLHPLSKNLINSAPDSDPEDRAFKSSISRRTCALFAFRVFFSFVWISSLHAEGVDEWIAEVLKANPDLQAAEADLAVAKGERRTAGQWKNPEVSMEYGEKRVENRVGELSAKGYSQRLAVSQTFEFPGKAFFRKAIANHQIEKAQLALEQSRREVAAKVRLLAVEWRTACLELQAAELVEERHETLFETLKKRASGGIQSEVDRRMISADRIRILSQTHQIEERKLGAQMALNVLRGRAPDAPIEMEVALQPPKLKEDLEALMAKGLRDNFEIQINGLDVVQSGKQVDQTRMGAAPDFTLTPFISKERAVDSEEVVGIGISMPLPLWDSNRGGVETARAREALAKAKESQGVRHLRLELSRQYHAYQHILYLLEKAPLGTLEELKQASEFADRQFRLGAIPSHAYLEMQDKYLEATSTLLQTIREGHDHYLSVLRLTGSSELLKSGGGLR